MPEKRAAEAAAHIARLQDRLQILVGVTRAFAEASGDGVRLLDTVARSIATVLGDDGAVMLLSEDGARLTPTALHHDDPEILQAMTVACAAPIEVKEHAVVRRVLESGEPFLGAVLDLEQMRSQTTPAWFEFAREIGLHSLMVAPLRWAGRAFGILVVRRHRTTSPPFTTGDLELLQALADQAAQALAHARAFAEERELRTRAERAVETQRLFFDESPQGSYVYAVDSLQMLMVNDAALELYGYSREEFLRLALTDILAPEDVGALQDLLRRAGDADVSTVACHRRKDGAPLYVAGRAHLFTYEGQRARIAVFQEAAAQRDAANALRNLREARESADTFRSFVEAAPDAVVIADDAGSIVLVNGQTETLFGYPRAELLGSPVDMLVPERHRARHPGHRGRYFAAPSVRTMGSGLQLHGLRKDGTEFPVDIGLSPIRTDGGTLVITSIRDVSARMVAAHALELARDRAEEANHELEAFSYSVAHDLRAPLRGIEGFAQILLESLAGKVDPDQRDWLEEITDNARKMSTLIDALLSLSRVTRTELSLGPVDLSALAREARDRLSASEPTRNVRFTIAPDLRVHADVRLARALVDNLMDNAFKFTNKRDQAHIEVGSVDGGATIFVRDDGAGFDMAYTSKLFAPFQRLHANRDFPGTGIGLATVQRIVRRHGGSVRAEGVPGAGATFHFSIPRPRETP